LPPFVRFSLNNETLIGHFVIGIIFAICSLQQKPLTLIPAFFLEAPLFFTLLVKQQETRRISSTVQYTGCLLFCKSQGDSQVKIY